MRQTSGFVRSLTCIATLVVCTGLCVGITGSSIAQDRKDPWEQPPRSLSPDPLKESPPNSALEKPDKMKDRKTRKKVKPGNQTKTRQKTPPVSAPSVLQDLGKPIKEAAVTVVPNELDLSTSDWGKTRVVEIKNIKAAVTLYSVWIKLKAQAPGVRLDDVDILSETGQEFISESFSGINANFDLMMFRALDADKQPCKYLLIYRLKGLESKFFKIKRKASKEAEKKPLVLSLSVSGFSEKSAPIATKDGAAALQFAPPESMTIEAISVLLKKEQ